jgi:chromosome segregation ATPase
MLDGLQECNGRKEEHREDIQQTVASLAAPSGDVEATVGQLLDDGAVERQRLDQVAAATSADVKSICATLEATQKANDSYVAFVGQELRSCATELAALAEDREREADLLLAACREAKDALDEIARMRHQVTGQSSVTSQYIIEGTEEEELVEDEEEEALEGEEEDPNEEEHVCSDTSLKDVGPDKSPPVALGQSHLQPCSPKRATPLAHAPEAAQADAVVDTTNGMPALVDCSKFSRQHAGGRKHASNSTWSKWKEFVLPAKR